MSKLRQPYKQQQARKNSKALNKDEKEMCHTISIKEGDDLFGKKITQSKLKAVLNCSRNMRMKSVAGNSKDKKLDNAIIGKIKSGGAPTKDEQKRLENKIKVASKFSPRSKAVVVKTYEKVLKNIGKQCTSMTRQGCRCKNIATQGQTCTIHSKKN